MSGNEPECIFLVERFLVRAKHDNKQVGLEKSAYIFPDEGEYFLNGRCLSCLNLPHGPVFLNMPKPSYFSRYDLAELYLKLKNYEKADKVIKAALEQEKGASMCSS